MTIVRVADTVRIVRRGPLLIRLRDGVDEQSVLDALADPGTVLKQHAKSTTKRVGEWAVKSSRFNRGAALARHTFRRARYRQGWRAACYLFNKGIPVPEPRAYVEHGGLGVLWRNDFICDFLEGCLDVQSFALHERNFEDHGLRTPEFLTNLAAAVNALTDAGAVHYDLAGKNILTRDGRTFYFIDLDDVRVGVPYREPARALNHAQIWLSLSRCCAPEVFDAFLEHVLPPGRTLEEWRGIVREAFNARMAASGSTDFPDWYNE